MLTPRFGGRYTVLPLDVCHGWCTLSCLISLICHPLHSTVAISYLRS